MLEGGPWLTLAEAAKRYGVPVTRLRRAAADHRLPTTRAGRDLWVHQKDLLAYLERVKPWHEGKRTGRPRSSPSSEREPRGHDEIGN